MNGNPVGCAAGLATLDELEKEGVYPRLYEVSERLRQGLEEAGGRLGLPFQVIGDGPVLQPVFTEAPVRNHADGLQADADAARRFGVEMIRRGVLVTPRGQALPVAGAQRRGRRPYPSGGRGLAAGREGHAPGSVRRPPPARRGRRKLKTSRYPSVSTDPVDEGRGSVKPY